MPEVRSCVICGQSFTVKFRCVKTRTCSNRCSNKLRYGPSEALFWAKVEHRGDRECWNWTGATNSSGYGGYGRDGEVVASHREAWRLTHGEIPDGLYILHHCDNRRCCNPNHLYAGTHQDNMRDKAERGRSYTRPGEAHHKAKLQNSDVCEIKRRWQNGERQVDLAECYGVTQGVVSRVTRGAGWSHVICE